jgi:ProP effector
MSGSIPKFDSNPLITLFAERWPRCFSVYEQRRRPLAVGIHAEIIASLEGIAGEAEIRRALSYYVRNPKYRKTLKVGSARIGLDGEPAGVVTEEQATKPKPKQDAKPAKKKQDKNRQHPAPRTRLHAANADKPRLSLKIWGRA